MEINSIKEIKEMDGTKKINNGESWQDEKEKTFIS